MRINSHRTCWSRWAAGGLFAALLTLPTCAPVERTHGHLWRAHHVSDIVVGEDSRDSVLEKVGSPSTVSLTETESWIYVTRRTETRSARRPDVLEQVVVVIEFDANDMVTAVRQLGLDDQFAVTFSELETPTRGQDLNLIQQLLGNIGRFEGGS